MYREGTMYLLLMDPDTSITITTFFGPDAAAEYHGRKRGSKVPHWLAGVQLSMSGLIGP